MTTRILLTGVNGFIGGHIAVRLLDAGYSICGSVWPADTDVEATQRYLQAALADPAAIQRLDFAVLDLSSDDGWRDAMAGCQAVVHTASPVPMRQPRRERTVVKPAVEGTLRVLKAAQDAGIARVVLTSSSVAVTEGHGKTRTEPFTEAEWTNVSARGLSPYTISKVMSERAAWDFVGQAAAPELVVINPGFTIGPVIFDNVSTSMRVIQRIVVNVDPAHPHFGYPLVDVRDVAEMHVRALEVPEAAGERFLGASRFMWYSDMVAVLADAFPDRNITTTALPSWIVRAAAPFKRRLASVVGILDAPMPVSTEKAERVLGTTFRDIEPSIILAGEHALRIKLERDGLPIR